jgi:hypothetical protein
MIKPLYSEIDFSVDFVVARKCQIMALKYFKIGRAYVVYWMCIVDYILLQ